MGFNCVWFSSFFLVSSQTYFTLKLIMNFFKNISFFYFFLLEYTILLIFVFMLISTPLGALKWRLVNITKLCYFNRIEKINKCFCVIFSNIFSLGNPQYFYCISKSLGWQSLCNPWDEMFATFNEEIYETCGAEMLV